MTPDEARLRQLWGTTDEDIIDTMAAQFVADVEDYLRKQANFNDYLKERDDE